MLVVGDTERERERECVCGGGGGGRGLGVCWGGRGENELHNVNKTINTS